MSFFFFHIQCLATYFHLNISGHEFVKWILGLPSNNVSVKLIIYVASNSKSSVITKRPLMFDTPFQN